MLQGSTLGLGLALGIALVGCSSSSTNDDSTGGGTGGGGTGGAGTGSTGAGGGGGVCDTSTHSCQPVPPTGWKPVHVVPGAATADCTDPKPGGSSVSAPPITCEACSCDDITGAGCATSVTLVYERGASSCNGAATCAKNVDTPTDGSCQPVPIVCSSPTVPNGVTVPPVPVVSGSCTPGLVAPPVLPEPELADLQTLCTPDVFPGDCDSGELCFANPPSGAIPRYCVSNVTSDPCPIAYPHERDVIYTGINDMRACSPCDCDLQGLECSVEIFNYLDPACPGVGGTIQPPTNQCYGFTNWESLQLTASVPPQTKCNPTGGAPVGELSVTDATKICCTLP